MTPFAITICFALALSLFVTLGLAYVSLIAVGLAHFALQKVTRRHEYLQRYVASAVDDWDDWGRKMETRVRDLNG